MKRKSSTLRRPQKKSERKRKREEYWGYQNRFPRRVEWKNFDTSLAFNFDATPEIPVTSLMLLAQGSDAINRIGRKIWVKSLHLQGTITYTPGMSTVGSVNIFLYVIWDKQSNGANPSIADVFDGSTCSAFRPNLGNKERFVVLHKMVQKMESTSGVSGAFNQDRYYLDWYRKMNMPIMYDNTTGVLTSLTTNNIFLIAGTDATEDDLCAIDGFARIRFQDD